VDEDEDEPETESVLPDEPAPAAVEAAQLAGDDSSTVESEVEVSVDDDEPPPELVWYVLKVQSGREDTIRDALERRVKIQDLGNYFGQIVVPKEKVTEIRNNKKRTVERKSYPGYIMVHMELNEKTWFVVRETPGVGDFVGAHGTPTPMSQAEIDKILKPEEPGETKAIPKIDLERGDRVKIKEGSFENFEGTVEEVIEARGLVKVMIIIFNRPTPVDLEYWQVERV
jgi:transcriptional antiterminator NusG